MYYTAAAAPAAGHPSPPEACCGSQASRWIVTAIVCASVTLSVNVVILGVSASWTGPLYVTFQVLLILSLISLITVCSLATCCFPGKFDRAAAYCSIVFLVLTVVAIASLSATTDDAARYSCSFQMDCDFFWPAGITGEDCESSKQRFFACYKPKQKEHGGGDLYYSKRDDCEQSGGDDDTCRGFRSVSDCVDYKWPDGDSDDECSSDTDKVINDINAVVISVSVFLFLTVIPAVGVALAVLACPETRSTGDPSQQHHQRRTPFGAVAHEPPMAHAFEIEMGTVTQVTTQHAPPHGGPPATQQQQQQPAANHPAGPNAPVAKLLPPQTM